MFDWFLVESPLWTWNAFVHHFKQTTEWSKICSLSDTHISYFCNSKSIATKLRPNFENWIQSKGIIVSMKAKIFEILIWKVLFLPKVQFLPKNRPSLLQRHVTSWQVIHRMLLRFRKWITPALQRPAVWRQPQPSVWESTLSCILSRLSPICSDIKNNIWLQLLNWWYHDICPKSSVFSILGKFGFSESDCSWNFNLNVIW
jgi:hypothetical protein